MDTLTQQRIRNRLIEYFDWAASFEDIAEMGAFETINSWEDWADCDSSFFVEPVFSLSEQKEIRDFYTAWNAASDGTPKDIFDAKTLSDMECWREFRTAAEVALHVFQQRGKFSEDEKEVFE